MYEQRTIAFDSIPGASALDFSEQADLRTQIAGLSLPPDASSPEHRIAVELHPWTDWIEADKALHAHVGYDACDAGKVACLVVAGGQGTRLGYQGPKGCYPLWADGSTLFSRLALRIAALSKSLGRPFPIAIMTSPCNEEMTRRYFALHNNFGLEEGQISIFSQSLLPLVDDSGAPFLTPDHKLAVGPTGNGMALHHLVESGTLALWQEKGVEAVTFLQVDNALADPADFILLGEHFTRDNEVTVKSVRREDPAESVGIFASSGGQVVVCEYSEVSPILRQKRTEEGELAFALANISNYCFSVEWLESAANCTESLPWHVAVKRAQGWNESGLYELHVHKYERFIFDHFRHAQKMSALLYDRESCFAPLKNSNGVNGPDYVRQRVLDWEKQRYRLLLGEEPPADRDWHFDHEILYTRPN